MANIDDSEVIFQIRDNADNSDVDEQNDVNAEIQNADHDDIYEEALAQPEIEADHSVKLNPHMLADIVHGEVQNAMEKMKDNFHESVRIQLSDLLKHKNEGVTMLGANNNQNQCSNSLGMGDPRISTPMLPAGPSNSLKVKPQSYDGSEDLSEFITHFNLVAEINGWNYGLKSLQLASCLTGDARALLTDLDRRTQRDYRELVEALNHRFGTENRAEIFKSQLKMRVRGKNETIPELAQSVRKLTKRAYPDASAGMLEVLALDHFIDAINETEIRMRLREVGPKNILEAEQIAVKLEAYKEADKDRRKTVRTCAESRETSLGDLNSEITKLQREIQNLKRNSSNQGGSRPRYNNNRGGYHGNRNNNHRMDLNGQNNADTNRNQGNGGRSQLGGAARLGQQDSPRYF